MTKVKSIYITLTNQNKLVHKIYLERKMFWNMIANAALKIHENQFGVITVENDLL